MSNEGVQYRWTCVLSYTVLAQILTDRQHAVVAGEEGVLSQMVVKILRTDACCKGKVHQ